MGMVSAGRKAAQSPALTGYATSRPARTLVFANQFYDIIACAPALAFRLHSYELNKNPVWILVTSVAAAASYYRATIAL